MPEVSLETTLQGLRLRKSLLFCAFGLSMGNNKSRRADLGTADPCSSYECVLIRLWLFLGISETAYLSRLGLGGISLYF